LTPVAPKLAITVVDVAAVTNVVALLVAAAVRLIAAVAAQVPVEAHPSNSHQLLRKAVATATTKLRPHRPQNDLNFECGSDS
jgi:hypothetical protein